MRRIGFVGAKGGVGTTSMACGFALAAAAATGRTVEVIDPTMDASAALGRMVDVSATIGTADVDLQVVDMGADASRVDVVDAWVLVVRNDYMALRRAAQMPTPDAVVLLVEPDRALTVGDVEDVLGVRCVEVAHDPAVARAIDAGLLAVRVPRSLSDALGQLPESLLHEAAL